MGLKQTKPLDETGLLLLEETEVEKPPDLWPLRRHAEVKLQQIQYYYRYGKIFI